MDVGKKARVEVAISGDGLEARVRAHPSKGAAPPLQPGQIMESLAKAGVNRGVDTEAVTRLVELTNSGDEPQTAVVAVGKAPVDAVPIRVELEVDREEIDMEAARVDYRAISAFVLVKTGEIVGRVKPAIQGEDGFNVRGKELKHGNAKANSFMLGTNVSQNGDQVVSDIDGRLEVRGNVMFVNEVLAVNEVGYSSGNIDFHGDVVIQGRVHDQFSIHTDGSLFTEEVLDASDVRVGHDLVARLGVVGRTGEVIVVGGEVQAKHLQNVHLKAGAFVLANSIHNSTIETGMGVAARRIMPGCRIVIGDEELVVDHVMNQVRITADIDGKLKTEPVILKDRK